MWRNTLETLRMLFERILNDMANMVMIIKGKKAQKARV